MVESPRRKSVRLIMFGATILASLAVAPAAIAQPYGHWTRLDSDAVPSGRRAAGGAYDSARHRLIVFGGFPTYLNDVWALDLSTQFWHPITPVGSPPSPRYGATAIYDALNDRLIVFGGFDGTVQNNDVWQLSLAGTPSWTQLVPTGTPPPGRSFQAGVYDAPRQRMVMFGGFNGSGFLGDTWELSLSGTPQWSPRTFVQPTPSARNIAAIAIDESADRLVLFGGWSGSYRNDTWVLPLAGTSEWSELLTAHQPPPRREISMAYDPIHERMVLFGGNDGSLRADTWTLGLSGVPDWKEESPVPVPDARYGHNTIFDPVTQGIVIYGGLENGGHSSRIWSLAPNLAQWDELGQFLPDVRNYSLVRDPVANSLLLFGGEQPALTNRMYRLDLSTDHWSRVLSGSPEPTPRYAQRAVWDAARDRMLVFGGYDEQYLNDLWEFRPRPVPAWTQLSPAGTPPEPRFAGGMVLDTERDRLVLFGGYHTTPNPLPPPHNFPVALNDLWTLPLSGPGAMVWQEESPDGPVPSPRWGQTMVMDDVRDRALVFGGGESAELVTAELYSLDLASDPPVWNLLVTPTSPPMRTLHGGVIDPEHDLLVVFGGYGGTAPLDDAWVWSLAGAPASWSPVPATLPAPGARNSIAASYDPVRERIIVPGGFGGSFFHDTWALTWDVPVPTLASLVAFEAQPGLVRLHWSVREANSIHATVERRKVEGAWEVLGAPEPSSHDRLSFEDATVVAGERYGYRLNIRESGESVFTEESLVEVPTGFRLALAGAWPNPSDGAPLTLAFSLARRGDARIEIVDIAGRRVTSRDLSTLEPGFHRLPLAGLRLEPGVYVLRLEAEGRVLTSKALVLR